MKKLLKSILIYMAHGDDRGAYYLGYMYEHGYGVETDIEKCTFIL